MSIVFRGVARKKLLPFLAFVLFFWELVGAQSWLESDRQAPKKTDAQPLQPIANGWQRTAGKRSSRSCFGTTLQGWTLPTVASALACCWVRVDKMFVCQRSGDRPHVKQGSVWPPFPGLGWQANRPDSPGLYLQISVLATVWTPRRSGF